MPRRGRGCWNQAGTAAYCGASLSARPKGTWIRWKTWAAVGRVPAPILWLSQCTHHRIYTSTNSIEFISTLKYTGFFLSFLQYFYFSKFWTFLLIQFTVSYWIITAKTPSKFRLVWLMSTLRCKLTRRLSVTCIFTCSLAMTRRLLPIF